MFFNFVFMFLWFYPPSAKTETKDTYKIPCRLYVNRGHFYFGQRGQPYFGFGGQINLGPRGHPRLGFPKGDTAEFMLVWDGSSNYYAYWLSHIS